MGSDKQQIKEEKKEPSKGSEKITGISVPAIVEDIIGRTGSSGEVTQVKCKIMAGDEKGKVMRRNVKGPIQLGDTLMLREFQIEARRIRGKVNKGAYT